MTRRAQAGVLPNGRLHLQDGPIDLVIEALGPRAATEQAYQAAATAFTGLLDALCAELPGLRARAEPGTPLNGPVARRMAAAVAPFAAETFITPMAAVAGAVADAVLAAITPDPRIVRASVNNGGDVALHCRAGPRFVIGMVDRPDRPSLFGRLSVGAGDAVRGVATSGWRGRSFSLGIADSVTVLARSAAEADAAATVIANAVDLPGHPAVRRAPADSLQPDSDLGSRLVTRGVGRLSAAEIDRALEAGFARAEQVRARGLILGAALQVQGRVRATPLPGLHLLTREPALA